MAVTIEASQTKKTPLFSRFVEQVRGVVRSEPDAERAGSAVAELLKPCLGSDAFLSCEQFRAAETDYCQHILHVEPDGSFSVVALVWLPGQATAIHDHVSWCVVGVHKGEEHETIYAMNGSNGDAHLRISGEHINPTGTVAALIPPGDIHLVANGGERVAVSIHVYGADIGKLGSSIRRRYVLDVRAAV
jgi:predicted metal-dependent enzyme (double-stranded beta helix superfamily)